MKRRVDLHGQTFGRLTVLRRVANVSIVPTRESGRTAWVCRCTCGREIVSQTHALKTGNTSSCGCMARGVKDETGKRYGRLTVIGRSDRSGQGAQWRCICDCGKEIETRGSSLRAGTSLSCGCAAIEKVRAIRLLPQGFAARNQIIRRTKANAAERGYVFELSNDDICSLMAQPCYYCGAEPSNVSQARDLNGSFVYGGIDRVDNGQGYVVGNVVPCCKHCNIAKRDRTVEEFLHWIERVYVHAASSRRGEQN